MKDNTAARKAGVALAGMIGCFGVLIGIYLLLARYVETQPESAAIVAQDRKSSYIPVISTAEAATLPETAYTTPDQPAVNLPAIELPSVAEMQNRIRNMLNQHEAARTAMWNDINQSNLRAAATIQCYQSGQVNCE